MGFVIACFFATDNGIFATQEVIVLSTPFVIPSKMIKKNQ